MKGNGSDVRGEELAKHKEALTMAEENLALGLRRIGFGVAVRLSQLKVGLDVDFLAL